MDKSVKGFDDFVLNKMYHTGVTFYRIKWFERFNLCATTNSYFC